MVVIKVTTLEVIENIFFLFCTTFSVISNFALSKLFLQYSSRRRFVSPKFDPSVKFEWRFILFFLVEAKLERQLTGRYRTVHRKLRMLMLVE